MVLVLIPFSLVLHVCFSAGFEMYAHQIAIYVLTGSILSVYIPLLMHLDYMAS